MTPERKEQIQKLNSLYQGLTGSGICAAWAQLAQAARQFYEITGETFEENEPEDRKKNAAMIIAFAAASARDKINLMIEVKALLEQAIKELNDEL